MTDRGSSRSRWTVAAATAVTLLVAGCASIDSAPVATSDVQPSIRVVVDTSGDARVEVTLRSGFRVLDLTEGESLTVRLNGGAPVTMVAGTGAFGLNSTYVAEIDASIDAGDDLTIAWNRVDLVDAPATVVTVPAPLSGARVTNAALSFDDDVALTWTPDGLGGEVDARVVVTSCAGASAEDLAAIAFFAGFPDTFPLADGAGEMDAIVLDPDGVTQCDAVVEVGRATADIDLDPAFDRLDSQSVVVHLGAEVDVTYGAP